MNKLMYDFRGTRIEVSQNWIRAMYASNNKIELVKMTRTFTGLGLKEAKDIVFNAVEFPDPSLYLYNKIEEYVKAKESIKTRELAERKAKIERETQELIGRTISQMGNGVEYAARSYKALGYPDPFVAAKAVVERHTQRYFEELRKIEESA